MTVIKRLAQARHLGACLALAAAAAVIVCKWPSSGILADGFYPREPRGVALYEICAVLLSVIIPSVALGATAQPEWLADVRRNVLALWTTGLLILPLVPFIAWYIRMQYFYESTEKLPPQPWMVLANLLIFAVIGLVMVRMLGIVRGSVVFIGVFVGLVMAQNWFGNEILFGTFSDSIDWQWNPAITATVVTLSALLLWRTRGGPALRDGT